MATATATLESIRSDAFLQISDTKWIAEELQKKLRRILENVDPQLVDKELKDGMLSYIKINKACIENL